MRAGQVALPAGVALAGEAAEHVTALLEAASLKTDGQGVSIGTVVLGQVEGDVHDIGRNIVRILLKSHGFKVIDLGRDVHASAFLDAAQKEKADIVGLSALMTTALPAQRRTVHLFDEVGMHDQFKIVIGGGATNALWADEIGADGFAPDAASAVELCKQLLDQAARHFRGALDLLPGDAAASKLLQRSLEYAKNLRVFECIHSRLTSIAPLAGLVNLESLAFNENEIGDLSPLAGLSGLGSAEVRTAPVPRRIAIHVAAEVIKVGRAAGYEVEPIYGIEAQRFVDATAGKGWEAVEADMAASVKFLTGGRPSMLQDVMKGRRTEIEYLNGYVSQQGRRLGVPTPVNDAVVAAVRSHGVGTLKPDPKNLEPLLKALPS